MTKVMIVDDSLFQRKNLARIVSRIGGVVVAEAANGKEAIELYPDVRPDVVLMDLIMPEMEGIEAVEKLLALDKKAKIVVISSLGYSEIVEKALHLGAKHFMTKPVHWELAASVIASVLEGT